MGQFLFLPLILITIPIGLSSFLYLVVNNYNIMLIFIIIIAYFIFCTISFFFFLSIRECCFQLFFFSFFFVFFNIIGERGIFLLIFIFFFFSLFFLQNILSLLPFQLTTTSFLIYTLSYSFILCFSITLTIISFFHVYFFLIFVPRNVLWLLIPLLSTIEVISYFMRPFSLGIRLFSNILAGHALIFILLFFSEFFLKICNSFFFEFFFFFPLIINIVIILLEILVSFLQAYVFTVLICIYLMDLISFFTFRELLICVDYYYFSNIFFSKFFSC